MLKTSFSFLIWLASTVAVCSAQSPITATPLPLWSAEVVPGLVETRTFSRPNIVDVSRAGVVFLDNNELIVYAVAVDNTQLSSRVSPEVSSPFRLRLYVLDANSGKLLLTKEWGTRRYGSAVQVTAAGVLVKTGEILTLYSRDFQTARRVDLPELHGYSLMSTSVSRGGNTLMVNRTNQGLDVSHLDVFDTRTLRLKYSWNQHPGLYQPYSISDTGIVKGTFDGSAVLRADFGSTAWRTIPKRPGSCVYLPTPLTNELLANACRGVTLISGEGEVLMSDASAAVSNASVEERSLGKLALAQGAGFAAESFNTVAVKKHLLGEPSEHLEGTYLEVYSLSLKKRVLRTEVVPLPKANYDFALSPDGSRLVVLNDRRVSLYPVPIQSAKDSRP